MNIKMRYIRISYSASANVRFISQNERRRYRIDAYARSLVMISYRSRYRRNIPGIHTELIQKAKSHNGARERMVDAVHKVSYIVKISRNLHKLNVMLAVAERFQNIFRRFLLRAQTNVP